MFLDQKLISAIIFEVNDSSLNYSLRPCTFSGVMASGFAFGSIAQVLVKCDSQCASIISPTVITLIENAPCASISTHI